MFHILYTSTVQNTASLADEGNYAYFQSSGAHNIKHINIWKLALGGNLCTDAQSLYGILLERGWGVVAIFLFSK